MNDIYSLLDEVAEYGNQSAEWYDKMVHKIPKAPVFNRAEYFIKAARNKVILDVGASGPMSDELRKVAKTYYSLDIQPGNGQGPYHYQLDLDKTIKLPIMPDDLELVIAGEVIEHLSNAGHFLDLLHPLGKPVILTTPNAFSAGGIGYLGKGIECVNGDHVAWYSFQTLMTLVKRHSFRVLLWAWYNGKPLTAEGLIFHMEPDNGKPEKESTS